MEDYGGVIRLAAGALEASVAPGRGFSLVSFRRNGLELLDPGAEGAFLKIRKGLGPLILPHFNQAGPLPRIDASGFPHAVELGKLGIAHPFQHGVGRYAAWEFSGGGDSVTGRLDGRMRWNGFSVSDLAGFDFSAAVTYSLKPGGLEVLFDLRGSMPVAAGIHFYYRIADRSSARIRMPSCIGDAPETLDLAEPVNKAFPVGETRKKDAVCVLETADYALDTVFPVGGAAEDSFRSLVIFSPAGAGFACVEPVSCPVGGENTAKTFRGRILLSPR